jgi:hypothetical protein
MPHAQPLTASQIEAERAEVEQSNAVLGKIKQVIEDLTETEPTSDLDETVNTLMEDTDEA